MPDDRAFLETILERPDEDAPRLVYADWLEERGECDRAGFIRVQCELATTRPGEKTALEEKERDLLSRHGKEWTAPLLQKLEQERRGLPPASIAAPFMQVMQQLFGPAIYRAVEAGELPAPSQGSREWIASLVNALADPAQFRPPIEALFQCQFRRGFVERIQLSAGDFIRHAETIFATAPLREAVIYDSPLGTDLEELFRCPALARLAGLELQSLLAPEAVLAFRGCPHLANLKRFSLERVTATRDDAHIICAATNLPSLRELNLARLPIGNTGASRLARNPAWGNLEALDLSRTGVGDDAVRAMAESPHLARLRRLDLSHNQVTAAGVLCLADSTTLANLRSLNLAHNRLAESVAQSLNRFVARMMGNPSVPPWLQHFLDSPLSQRLDTLTLDRDALDPADRAVAQQHLGPRLQWA